MSFTHGLKCCGCHRLAEAKARFGFQPLGRHQQASHSRRSAATRPVELGSARALACRGRPRCVYGVQPERGIHPAGTREVPPCQFTATALKLPGPLRTKVRAPGAKHAPAPSPTTFLRSSESLFSGQVVRPSRPARRRSEHARARVLPKSDCIFHAGEPHVSPRRGRSESE